MAANTDELKLSDSVKKLLSFLISNIWEINVDASNGYFINIEDKTNEIINFFKEHDFTEEEMTCLEDISSEKLIGVLMTTAEW